MEWYLPITILPAIGLLIMSTSNQMMALSAEIGNMLSKKCTPFQHEISDMKIKQLEKLTKSITLQYTSSAFLVISGLLSARIHDGMLSEGSIYILIIGVLMVLISLCYLVFYAFKAIRIRKLQHKHNHDMYDSSNSENN